MAPMSGRPYTDDARRLSVQQTASRVLLEHASLDEAMAEILRALATELDWALAVYWVVAPSAPGARPTLQCRAISAEESILRTAIVEATRAAVLKLGEDPAGNAAAGREPVWIEQLGADDSSLRMRLAVAAGLRSVAAFPVRQRESVPAIIELFARDVRPVDEGMLHLMTALGQQICLVLHREEAQAAALEALERSREELETVLSALPDGITVRDGAGRLVYANEAIARAVGLPGSARLPRRAAGAIPHVGREGPPALGGRDSAGRPPAGGEERLLRYRPIGQDRASRSRRRRSLVSVKAAPVAAARGGAGAW